MLDEDKPGYGRPPRGRRFGQPGGNPRGPGRPKGSKNIATIFAAVASTTVAAKDGKGGTRKMSKLEAAITQLTNQAASGDLRAINMLLALAQGLEARAEQHNTPDVVLTEADRKVIALMARRIEAQLKESGDE